MIDDEDDSAAERVYDALSSDTDMMEAAIAIYTVAGGDSAMLEAVRKESGS
uniref:Uncharacterized protein n=1 Tax=Salmonella sp. TaxID=599 RepID=A0A482EW38_SALSP|nr:hypothetical protein [Salmonella sp.]QBM91479.1 hypothetical protein NNIBIDOC_00150 [Salmonella sp.]